MKSFSCLRKSKRGQFGFDLPDVFSYLGYFIAIMIIWIILTLPSCLTGIDTNKGNLKLQEKTEAMALLKADAQLASFLQTQMPGKVELFAKLDWLGQPKVVLRTNIVDSDNPARGTSWRNIDAKPDVGKAKLFLNSHPEIYVDKDYSGFISSLQAVYAADNNERDNVETAFKAVTSALFLRAVGDVDNDIEKLKYFYYLFPLDVDFQNANPGNPGIKADYDLSVGITPDEMLPERTPVFAIQVVPLADSTMAKVRLAYYPELLSWLPQP